MIGDCMEELSRAVPSSGTSMQPTALRRPTVVVVVGDGLASYDTSLSAGRPNRSCIKAPPPLPRRSNKRRRQSALSSNRANLLPRPPLLKQARSQATKMAGQLKAKILAAAAVAVVVASSLVGTASAADAPAAAPTSGATGAAPAFAAVSVAAAAFGYIFC
ncbi:hypothetical protein ZWY2020_050783 [Hordeum vulgare]|nr:hypothetical protein ZWY2020_050783 [Hordeum vulgare]